MKKNETVGLDFWRTLPPSIDNAKSVELVKEYQTYGDEKAKEEVFYGNLRFVRFYVRKYCADMVRRHTQIDPDIEDLFQVGSLALLRAIDSFCPDYAFKFSTYVGKSIYRTINGYMYRENKSAPSSLNLDDPLDDKNNYTFVDTLEDERDDFGALERKMDYDILKAKVMPYLEKKEKRILEEYFMKGMTYQQIADGLGMSKQGVKIRMEKILKFFADNYNRPANNITGLGEYTKPQTRMLYKQKLLKKYGQDFLENYFVYALPKAKGTAFKTLVLDYQGETIKEVAEKTNLPGFSFKSLYEYIDGLIDDYYENYKNGIAIEKNERIYKRNIQRSNRNARLVDEAGGLEFLQKYFVPTLDAKQKKVFDVFFVKNEPYSMSKLGSMYHITHLEERYKELFHTIESTDFDYLVKLQDAPEEVKTQHLPNAKNLQKRRKEILGTFGKEFLKKYFVPILTPKQAKLFTEVYLTDKYQTLADYAKETGLMPGTVSSQNVRIINKLANTTKEELVTLYNQAKKDTEIVLTKGTKSRKSKKEKVIMEYGGLPFLEECFVPTLSPRAYAVIFEDFVIGDKSVAQINEELALNKNSTYVYVVATKLRKQLALFKESFDDFQGAVTYFYMKKDFEEKHAEDFKKLTSPSPKTKKDSKKDSPENK